MDRRTQLTLFLPAESTGEIEALRRMLDPVQADLIAVHVTFAREDELARVSPEVLEERLEGLFERALRMAFGGPEGFGGHGILLPCIAGEEAFHALRARVLGGALLRRQSPHITLAHPRNPQASGNAPATLARVPPRTVVRFTSIHRIEQEAAGPWQVRGLYALRSRPRQAP